MPTPPPLNPQPGPAALPPPQVHAAPPAGRKFPCKQCGARLDFDSSARALHCPYCGHVEHIAPATREVHATDWDAYWAKHQTEEGSISGLSSQVTCPACGAVVLMEDRVAADKCPYCSTFLENKPESAKGLIAPAGLLPFRVTEPQARDAFNRWVAGRWFAPAGLRQLANLGRLSGMYVPFWAYDSMTYSHYWGERGDDYTETETYTETDANGQQVTRTRQVTKTRWTPVSGEVQYFFENVLVCGSHSLPDRYIGALAPWELQKLEPPREEFLSGFQAERYAVGLREGFDRAREVMDAAIRQRCTQAIGGNHQRLHGVHTQYVGITFRHILLPVWLAAYRYYDRPYRILVNGQTGKVVGERPYSWVKITLFVLLILALVGAAVFFFTQVARGAPPARAGTPGPRAGHRGIASGVRRQYAAQWGRTPPAAPQRTPFPVPEIRSRGAPRRASRTTYEEVPPCPAAGSRPPACSPL